MKEPTSTVRQEVERMLQEFSHVFGRGKYEELVALEMCPWLDKELSTLLQRIEEMVPEEMHDEGNFQYQVGYNDARDEMLRNLKGEQ